MIVFVMSSTASRSNVTDTVSRLRAEVLSRDDGAFLGNEEALQRLLGVSKPTVRQAARVVEREGLLRVRRGNNGGYFGARPDAAVVEATVASYLEVLGARPEHLTRVATALWIETVREAAALGTAHCARAMSAHLRELARLPGDASFAQVQAFEHRVRKSVFEIAGSAYVELIFDINANFARRLFVQSPAGEARDDRHLLFVETWRKATKLELTAIAEGDVEVAVLAAFRARDAIHIRIWGRAASEGGT